jgi:hypothetical protein
VYGARELDRAAADLAFLETATSGVVGGTISGRVRQQEVICDREASIYSPLEGIVVRVSNEAVATEAVTGADGRFTSSVPAGRYRVEPQLPDGVTLLDACITRFTRISRMPNTLSNQRPW